MLMATIRGTMVLLAVLIAVMSIGARAQDTVPDLSGFWSVRFEQVPSGQALIDELPEDALLIDDTGAGELGAGDFGGLKLSPRSIAEAERYDFQDELKTENTCNPPSAAFYMQAPFPMEIYAGRDIIVFKMEYFDMFRIIFLDGRSHPPGDAPHSKSGHSIGHWDDDTLVVDTTHLVASTFMNNGFNHSSDIHMIERFRLSPDGSTLWLTQQYRDPATFEGLAARYMAWGIVPGEYVFPYDCDPSYGV